MPGKPLIAAKPAKNTSGALTSRVRAVGGSSRLSTMRAQDEEDLVGRSDDACE